MTADIRTAAQKEADRRYQDDLDGFEDLCPDAQEGFALGAVWAQARLTPTREQLTEELRKHKLIHVSVSRKSAFCACDPSVIAGVDDNRAWYEAHMADAVLALMAGLAEGESSERE